MDDSPEFILLTERLKKLGNIVEILDESKPAYDLEELYRKYTGTLIGDYVGSFMGRDLTVVEEKALYHGLQALLGNQHIKSNGGKDLIIKRISCQEFRQTS